jgi:two-component system response regulator DevR
MINGNGKTGDTRGEIRVLVVDEQPTMRLGVRRAVEAEEGMLVVGEVGDVEEALRLVEESHPDVVVMDLVLRGGEGGTELLRRLKSEPDAPGVVVHTARNSEEDVFASRASGADSFVYKGEGPSRLVEAVKETHARKRVWFLGRRRQDSDTRSIDHHPHANLGTPFLTPREKEVFSLLLQRYTNAEIARDLSISLQTAKNHVSSVLRKLGATRRADLF